MSHIFPNVCLMKYHNRHGVYFPAVLCRLCCHPKTLGFKRRDTDSLKSFKSTHWGLEITKTKKYSSLRKSKGAENLVSQVHRLKIDPSWIKRYFIFITASICTHQRNVCHGVHHYSLVLRSIFSDSTQSRFQHMVPIQEGLLCSRFYPHFVL